MNLSTCILRSGAVFGDGYDKTHFHFRWQARGILVFFDVLKVRIFMFCFYVLGWVRGGWGVGWGDNNVLTAPIMLHF